MRKPSIAHRSRRAPPLKDSDYDHEINLVDHAAEVVAPQAIQTHQAPTKPQPGIHDGPSSSLQRHRSSGSVASRVSRSISKRSSSGASSLGQGLPRVEVTQPTPLEGSQSTPPDTNGVSRPRASSETAVDVLYENERGWLLCGIPLFSPKALGQLDPPNWTNFAHKPSPTSIQTAQVPDPSWVWSWPEWHINKDEGVDDNGWEYSFMFAKIFSWHTARWYNSCVRRRAWTRQRVKRDADSNDPHMLNTEYFTVRRSAETDRSCSRESSRNGRAIAGVSSWLSAEAGRKPEIKDMETLMAILTRSRIDREKIEAVENLLQHGEDELLHLQHKMHEIMGLFVFQASRRVLLAKLNAFFEETQRELRDKDTGKLQRRSNNLKGAIQHADEECRRMEYWSDVKKLVRERKTTTATDSCGGLGRGLARR